MNQAERREAIKQILNVRRSEKIENLAAELNVSVRTIKYDIEALTCSYPIESVRGRYIADSEAGTVAALREDFNRLLSALREAGVMASAPDE